MPCSGIEFAGLGLPCKCGSPGRARTADLVINSHPLYRLSYRGIGGMSMLIPAPVAVNRCAPPRQLSSVSRVRVTSVSMFLKSVLNDSRKCPGMPNSIPGYRRAMRRLRQMLSWHEVVCRKPGNRSRILICHRFKICESHRRSGI